MEKKIFNLNLNWQMKINFFLYSTLTNEITFIIQVALLKYMLYYILYYIICIAKVQSENIL